MGSSRRVYDSPTFQKTRPVTAPDSGPDEGQQAAVQSLPAHPIRQATSVFHTVVFEPWDRLKLAANPARSVGERFQLADLEVSLVGVSETPAPAQRDLDKSVPPVRIIERSVEIADTSHSHLEAETPVEDLLREYLDTSGESDTQASGTGQTFNDAQPSSNHIDDLLRDYVDDTTTDSGNVGGMLRNYLDVPQSEQEPVVNTEGAMCTFRPKYEWMHLLIRRIKHLLNRYRLRQS